MAYAGIDLSLTSPAICVFQGQGDFNIDQCIFYYMTDTPKRVYQGNNINGSSFPQYATSYERYDNISKWALSIVATFGIDTVYIEDYSFGSTGRIFNIAENTGILKYNLWKQGVEIYTIPPTVVKMMATGKGNANKEQMQLSFIEETKVDIKQMLSLTEKQWNPSSDIIDSYYICKFGSLPESPT